MLRVQTKEEKSRLRRPSFKLKTDPLSLEYIYALEYQNKSTRDVLETSRLQGMQVRLVII